MKKIAVIANLIWIWLFAACQPLTSEAGRPTAAPTPGQVIQQGEEPKSGGTLVFSFGAGDPRHFNPALLSGSATVIPGAQIFASPLRYDGNWNPQPYLAQSWEIAADGLAVTLKLVEGATFHDGEPITSADVAFSLRTVQEHHPFKTMFAPVTGIDTPNPQTAIIHLSHPHPAILMAMSPAFFPILPAHIYGDGQDLATHPANLEPVGSGPFKFVSFEPGKRIVLERFEDYFLPEKPYLERIEFWIDLNPASQVVSLTRQDAQLAAPYLNLEGLDQLSTLDYYEMTQVGYEGIGAINWLAFNLLREPLSDIRVRQAIAYAIDMDFITQYLHQGLSKRAPSPIIASSPFFDPELPTYLYDPGKAADLLDEAGYEPGQDGVRFSLTLDYIPVLPTQQHDVAYYIQNQLEDIGIDVLVRDSASFPEWAQRIGQWDFDMTMDAVFNWGDPVIGVHRTYISENIRPGMVWSNTQNYANSRVDKILSQAAVELDIEKRKSLYHEFQKIVAEELPVIWINELPNHTIYHTGLGNPPLSIWGVHSPLDEVFWKEPPQTSFVPPPKIDAESDFEIVVTIGVRAIQLIQDNDFYTAREVLSNPETGFSDLEGTGLHVIGFNKDGVLFLDNSGQLNAGDDISFLLDINGELVLPMLVKTAENFGDEHIHLDGAWPHPATQSLESFSVWCGKVTKDDIICALAWIPHE